MRAQLSYLSFLILILILTLLCSVLSPARADQLEFN